MFSPLLIKIGFATISSLGVAIGGYFLYKKTSSSKSVSSETTEQKNENGPLPSGEYVSAVTSTTTGSQP